MLFLYFYISPLNNNVVSPLYVYVHCVDAFLKNMSTVTRRKLYSDDQQRINNCLKGLKVKWLETDYGYEGRTSINNLNISVLSEDYICRRHCTIRRERIRHKSMYIVHPFSYTHNEKFKERALRILRSGVTYNQCSANFKVFE